MNIKKSFDKQRERIMEKLDQTDPGTKEYRELQAQLGAFDIMQEKKSCGSVTAADWLKFAGTLVSTGLLITADQWFPAVTSKLKISEFVQKLFR